MRFLNIFIKTLCALLITYAIAVLCGSFILHYYFMRTAAESVTIPETLIEVPYGSSLRKVSSLLYEAGVIDSPRKFYWYVRLGRDDGDRIQAGYYNFSGQISKEIVAERLLLGIDQAYRVTFKEGETLVDLVRKLEDAGLVTKSEFVETMANDEVVSLINAPNANWRKNLENDVGGIEGYLYPDTYFFNKKDKSIDIIRKMYNRLMRVLNVELGQSIGPSKYSMHELLTLASIIEKETGDPTERSIISSVYQNRLRLGMRLQADPTVIYGIKNYNGKISKRDLLMEHPYNTYKIKGLPPGPIAAPGLMSLRAALKPKNTNYLYFVSKNNGSHVFCENLVCHNQAVRRWQIDYFRKASVKR